MSHARNIPGEEPSSSFSVSLGLFPSILDTMPCHLIPDMHLARYRHTVTNSNISLSLYFSHLHLSPLHTHTNSLTHSLLPVSSPLLFFPGSLFFRFVYFVPCPIRLPSHVFAFYPCLPYLTLPSSFSLHFFSLLRVLVPFPFNISHSFTQHT